MKSFKAIKKRPVLPTTHKSMEILTSMFGIEPGDKFNLSGISDFMSLHVEKPDGRVISQKFRTDGSFRQVTVFNKGTVDPEERRKIVVQLDKDGLSQSAIADLLGISQPTVSLDLQRAKLEKKAKAPVQIEVAPKKKLLILKKPKK
ncbi:sigma-70 family RNA polymerase sigma factor [Rhizobium leguminosarum]|uniref:sigma factor-like helix-turn-helix DNA-binding protein n=1 Tax=Rhizobium leguminosarum TaxID=384 RepID=UPI001C9785D4|nr:helix-turn-helix domain-containing protein [Rhizobium leguminosarum]MBY5551027.1 sigma-70 family RNA polymerase sigma factor [Rhizobium leguminosarum]